MADPATGQPSKVGQSLSITSFTNFPNLHHPKSPKNLSLPSIPNFLPKEKQAINIDTEVQRQQQQHIVDQISEQQFPGPEVYRDEQVVQEALMNAIFHKPL